jgi:hypothetical protein
MKIMKCNQNISNISQDVLKENGHINQLGFNQLIMDDKQQVRTYMKNENMCISRTMKCLVEGIALKTGYTLSNIFMEQKRLKFLLPFPPFYICFFIALPFSLSFSPLFLSLFFDSYGFISSIPQLAWH